MVKILDSRMQAEKCPRSFCLLEAWLLSLLTPCGTAGLLSDGVATSAENPLLVVNMTERRAFPDCSSATPQLIGVNDP